MLPATFRMSVIRKGVTEIAIQVSVTERNNFI
jgi:hypothetical protein